MSDTIARGERAQQILDDPLVKEALQALQDGVRDLFFGLPEHAAREREMLHLMDRARQQFVGIFTLLIHGATVEKAELLAQEHTQARLDAIRRAAAAR